MAIESSTSSAWYERAHIESDQPPLGPVGRRAALRGYSDELHASVEVQVFCTARGLNTGPFARMGALVNGSVLAFPYAAGIKFRNMDTGARRSVGRFLRHPLNTFYGSEPYARVLVAESETDAAALLELYPASDVAVMPCGALCWSPIWTAQLGAWDTVAVALDADDAGEAGWSKIAAELPRATRHAPPEGVKDWGAWQAAHPADQAPELPLALRRRPIEETNTTNGEKSGNLRRLRGPYRTTTNGRKLPPATQPRPVRETIEHLRAAQERRS